MSTSSDRRVAVDVVVPTYRRPQLIERCLVALGRQECSPQHVIVVARDGDAPTWRVLRRWEERMPCLTTVAVSEPGVLAAMSAGVAASRSAVIAFTDDDAAPRPDWLRRLGAHFAAPDVGGVGGRDLVPGQEGPLTEQVGVFGRSGRLTGNHHLGSGPARDVDVLKGVNMAFRAEALGLPRAGVLRGDGAEAHFEILVCSFARARGWRLIYDPAVLVDHEGAARQGADQRVRPRASALVAASHNWAFATSIRRGSRARLASLYGPIVGSKGEPGALRALVALGRGEWNVAMRAPASIAGHLLGIARSRSNQTLEQVMLSAEELRHGMTRTIPRLVATADG